MAVAFDGVAKAESTNGFSMEYEAGLMHSNAVHLLDTKPSGTAAPGEGFGAIPSVGLSGLWEYEGLVIGGRSDLAVGLFPARPEIFLGGFTGFRFGWGAWRMQIDAELGEHLLWSIGGGEFQCCSDHALLPFVGARVEVGHAKSVGPGHLGLAVFIRQDLEQQAVSATAVINDTNEDVHFSYMADYMIGGTTVGLTWSFTTN